MQCLRPFVFKLACIALVATSAASCANGRQHEAMTGSTVGSDGPLVQGKSVAREDGDARAGRDVYRFETFGNERFWTDAVRMPAGMMDAHVTPMAMLELGLQIDVDALDPTLRTTLAAQLKADPSGRNAPLLNDPQVTAKLVSENAVVGMPTKDSNGDGLMDITKGDKVGATCALCHTMADASLFRSPHGGSIGHRLDGLANHSLNMGKIFATAGNSRALYPILQLALRANGGKSLGRAPTGLTETSSEADVDAYLSNPQNYPIGMFDDTFDGNGDPMHNSALFRQDLAAPYGTEGTIARLDNFSNLVYTSLLDQTTLTTPGGRAFLHKLGGAAGDEIADNYVKVLAATGVTGYPYVRATPNPNPGSEDAPVGVRVDETKLRDLNAYMVSLQAPRGASVDAALSAQGRSTFRTAGCTTCHNVDQSRPVPTTMIAMKTIFPGDNPVTLAQRTPPLNPVLNTVESIFDDKMAVVNASLRGDIRGTALPLLLDLDRKPVFLHDNSVPSMEALVDSSRGARAPHPFYLPDARQRAAVIAFLRGLDTHNGRAQ